MSLLNIYDRPGVALANVASGDLSGGIDAIFRPQELSPQEMQNLRERFLKHKAAKNPFVKTVVDLATNPLMFIGLAMALHPTYGRVANAKDLLKVTKEGGKYVKDVNKFLTGIMSPFTSSRALHHTGLWDTALDFVDDSSRMSQELQDKLDDAIKWFQTNSKDGKLTTRRLILAYQKAGGWDKPLKYRTLSDGTREVVSGIPMQQYYKNVFKEGEVMSEGLNQAIRNEDQALFGFAEKLRGIYDHAKTKLGLDDIEVLRDLALKGTDISPNYMPQMTTQTPLESMVFKAVGGKGARRSYEKMIAQITEGYTPGIINQRMGQSLPLQSHLDEVKDVFSPTMWKKLQSLERIQVDRFRDTLRNLATVPEIATPQVIEKAMEDLNPSAVARLRKGGGMDEFLASVQTTLRGMKSMTNPKDFEQTLNHLAQHLGAPARYSMDAASVTRRYAQVSGPTFAWYTRKGGDRLMGIMKDVQAQMQAQLFVPENNAKGLRMIYDEWNDSIIPMLRGLKDPREWARQQKWLDQAYRSSVWLSKEGTAQKLIPKPLRDWMFKNLSGQAGSLSEKTWGGMIASAYYGGALGANISPVSKNLLQNLLTTMPITGPRNLAMGISHVTGRIPKLMALGPKIGWDNAIAKVFPEYAEKFGTEGIASAMASGDLAMERRALGMARGGWDKVKKGMMMPFATSEKFNRLTAFYSAHKMALRDGLEAADASEFARRLTMQTQFTGGVLGQPKALRGVWTPFRQFMHFPMRYGEYLYGSMRMGPDPNVRSLGVLGRGLVGSATTYTIAKNFLGMDLTGGLMTGALPTPAYEGAPFYPFPFVPPLVGQVGEVARSVLTGDYSKLPAAAAIALPGGLGIRRGFKTFSPKYADYKNRTPDGRIPVYNDKNMLIGNMTPTQLFMRGIGIKPAEVQNEQDMMAYLLRHRDKIRQYRRDYLEALARNDVEQAEKVNKQFQKKYNGLGPLRVKKADIKSVRNRHTISRLNRTLKGFPEEYRPMFQQMVEQAKLAQFAQDIDNDPTGSTLMNYLP